MFTERIALRGSSKSKQRFAADFDLSESLQQGAKHSSFETRVCRGFVSGRPKQKSEIEFDCALWAEVIDTFIGERHYPGACRIFP